MKKYCQGTKCHTYDTSDRKRGTKGNKVNQTRSLGTYTYGNGNFCTLGCQNDWWETHGTRVVEYVGRVNEPLILTEENGWKKRYNPDYYGRIDTANVPQFIEVNMFTKATRPLGGNDE